MCDQFLAKRGKMSSAGDHVSRSPVLNLLEFVTIVKGGKTA